MCESYCICLLFPVCGCVNLFVCVCVCVRVLVCVGECGTLKDVREVIYVRQRDENINTEKSSCKPRQPLSHLFSLK